MKFDTTADAYEYFESHRDHCLTLWVEMCFPEGLFCPSCECYIDVMPEDGNGRRVRCPDCNIRINVFAGSLLETSNLSLAIWLTIIWNATCSSKKRCSGHVLASMFGCSYYKISSAIKAAAAVKCRLRKGGQRRYSNWFEAVARGCRGVEITH